MAEYTEIQQARDTSFLVGVRYGRETERAALEKAGLSPAKVWEEAVQAVSWALENGGLPVGSALSYTVKHNPYKEG